VVAGDFDGDGFADIYAVQNSFSPVASTGRFDGGLSQLLRGDGRGGFACVAPEASGLVVPGDAKALVSLDLNADGWPDFLASRNGESTLAFVQSPQVGRGYVAVRAVGARGNPSAIGARLTLTLSDGVSQTVELTAGSGYYSQGAAVARFGYMLANPPRELSVRWPDGRITRQRFESAPPATVEVRFPE
jgi:hypothetical protein